MKVMVLKSIGSSVFDLKVFEKKPTHQWLDTVLTNWGRIVGKELSERTQPVKIVLTKGKKQFALWIKATPADSIKCYYTQRAILKNIKLYTGSNVINTIHFIHKNNS